jgi:hypothetical protein
MKKTLNSLILSALFILPGVIKAQIPLAPAGAGNTMMLTYVDNGRSYMSGTKKKAVQTQVGDLALLVWDRKTGKSTGWHFDQKQWTTDVPQLPEQPISGATGNIMMVEVHESHPLILIWDTKTGKSKIYEISEQKWEETGYPLPEKPLEGATGEIAMYATKRGQGGEVFITVWDTKSGKSKSYTHAVNNSSNSADRSVHSNGNTMGTNKPEFSEEKVVVLPEKPLSSATGNILIYPYVGSKSFIAYDTKSGASACWAFNSQLGQLEPGKISLPSKLVEGASGQVLFIPNIYGNTTFFCWDTKTGKSTFYTFAGSKVNIGKSQMPETPMENPQGLVMFTRFMYAPSDSYNIAWDTKTGNTALYQYSDGSKSWVKINAQLPSPLLK